MYQFALEFLRQNQYPHPEHAQEVLQILLDAGVTDPTIHIAALLHDAQDYTSITKQEIADQFGLNVAGITTELFLDLKNPSSNFLTELLNRANTLSTESTSILLADLVFSMLDDHQFKEEKEHYNRNIFAWMREVVSRLNNPNPLLINRLNSAFNGIYANFPTWPRHETQQNVWYEMKQIVEGQNNDPE